MVEGDTFSELAQRFYDYDARAETCIRQANFLFNSDTERFQLMTDQDITTGIKTIIPVRSSVYC